LRVIARCSAEGAVPATATTPASTTEVKSDGPAPSPLQRVRQWFFGGKLDKERLKSLGFGALIAYGCETTSSSAVHTVPER
jgi:hypothetical protein